MERAAGDRLPVGRERLVGLLFLVTGVGLVVHILVGLPLWLAVPGGLVVVAALLWRAGVFSGLDLRPTVLVGLAAGAAAIVAYDLTRLLVVELFALSVQPFEARRFFGQALIGGASVAGQWVAGALFHLTNGVAFAVAYTVWFGGRGVRWGIGWGLFLEAFMLGLYPGWLHITDYGPFVVVSLAGHVVYGAALGAGSKILLARLTTDG